MKRALSIILIWASCLCLLPGCTGSSGKQVCLDFLSKISSGDYEGAYNLLDGAVTFIPDETAGVDPSKPIDPNEKPDYVALAKLEPNRESEGLISKNQFIEYTKDGYSTTFTITKVAPRERWEFDMENDTMKGIGQEVLRKKTVTRRLILPKK